jgi:Holliday junction DNA helicase RuvA
MIRYLKGQLLKKEDDRVIVLANGVGYEVLLPQIVRQTYNAKKTGDDVELYISYQQTERQPKPKLIGFNFEAEREFFEQFITVEGVGPAKAATALNMPVHKVAKAIEEGDTEALVGLKGIATPTAKKIIASLQGKLAKFALMREDMIPVSVVPEDVDEQIEEVLIKQLGYKKLEARQLIKEARQRNPSISTPEELFDEIYRGQKP